MADLSGPKMRIGKLAEEPVELKPGDPFVLTTDEIDGDRRRVSVSFKRLPQAVKPGDALFLNDGIIQLEVVSVAGNDVACRVVVGGELRSRKGLNLPGIDLGIGAFTERDHECLKFAAQSGDRRRQPVLRRERRRHTDRARGGGGARLPPLHHRQDRALPCPGTHR